MSKNKVIGLVSLLLGILALIGTFMIKVAKMAVSMGDPGPKVFPSVAGVLLVICGIGLLVRREENEPVFMTKSQWMRLLALFLVFVGYVVLLYFIGFVGATTILLFVMMTMFSGAEKLSIPVRLVYAIAVTAVIYLLFAVMLKTNVPKGILL
jgi:hypothetical protein